MEPGKERGDDARGLGRSEKVSADLNMPTKTQLLEPRVATEAWIRRGLMDFFLAFELFRHVNIHLFFLQQGIEKFCKAYLIALKKAEYQNSAPDQATEWIDNFAKGLRHDLVGLIRDVSATEVALKPWLQNSAFLDLLNRAEQEGRYPIPIAKSIYEDHGLAAVVSDRNYKQAFAMGKAILDQLEISSGWAFSLEALMPRSISKEDWDRFVRVWEMSHG